MIRIIKKAMPFVLAVLIAFQSVYLSVQTAQASAIPEVLYYTYWDLINTIYATCGYDSKVDESVVNNHGVTGKQAWSNFVTFVENSAKANYKFVGDGMSKAFSELENLVNTATEKGISMTQDLYDMLKSVFADQVVNNNKFNTLSEDSIKNMIYSICGVKSGSLGDFGVVRNVSNGLLLNIVYADGKYSVFTSDSKNTCIIDVREYPNGMYGCWFKDGSGRSAFTGFAADCAVIDTSGKLKEGRFANSFYTYPSFIIRNGAFVGTDTIGAQVSEGACPQEVPEVAPWRKSVDIPDEWRVINPNETPEQNPDDKPEVLPVIIPINPTKPDTKPDTESTENPDTETTENPDKDKDPDKKKNPVVNPIINPDTGNVVDPNTGWDIDPSTGKLINPNTGELVDPDMSNPSSITNKFGDITKLFPFCIPFDLIRLIKGMSADKQPPVFHYEHKFKDINYTFVVDVDLSNYDKYIKLFRFGMQIFYIIALMFLTSKISNYFA